MSDRMAVLRRDYGRQTRQVAADGAGRAVLDFTAPPKGMAFVIHHVFVRGAVGQTVRMFIGGNPGTVDANFEVDTSTLNPAINGPDEMYVEEAEQVWVEVTGVPAATTCFASIRYRILGSEF